jgi:murein DD-endopeptidase MepM/ murein hydrolase activator NlpD
MVMKIATGESNDMTEDGKSLRKAFLRSPLAFTRITSGYSLARLHPFMQTWRAHKGVDFAAPNGTPVRAAGDGKVQLAGRQNGYGNVVVLQHAGAYSTVYAHLSQFASGMKPGSHVTPDSSSTKVRSGNLLNTPLLIRLSN